MRSRYFPGLNALRFYAALAVVIQHLGSYTVWIDIPASRRAINFLFIEGRDAVGLFFVLSGFLITYLLLSEDAAGSIDVPRFYARRALRIWPAYYAAVFAGYLVVPLLAGQPLTASGLPEVLLMLPNLSAALGTLPGVVNPLWSIGVEEQFYLAWPLLMKRLRRYLPLLFTGVIVVRVSLELIATLSGSAFWLLLIDGLRFDSMAIGGIGAYLLFQQRAALKWIYHPVLRRLAYAIFLINIPFPLAYGTPQTAMPFLNLLLSVVFLVVIINLTARGARWLEHPILNSLGKVSYGMYVYHAPVIYLVLFTMRRWSIPFSDAAYYPASIGLTIAAAFASYRFIETPFLRRKPQPLGQKNLTADLTPKPSP